MQRLWHWRLFTLKSWKHEIHFVKKKNSKNKKERKKKKRNSFGLGTSLPRRINSVCPLRSISPTKHATDPYPLEFPPNNTFHNLCELSRTHIERGDNHDSVLFSQPMGQMSLRAGRRGCLCRYLDCHSFSFRNITFQIEM